MLEEKPTDFKSALTQHDIFEKIKENSSGDDGTVLAEVRDLRTYLILLECEMMRQGVVGAHNFEKDDESLHANFNPLDHITKDGQGGGFGYSG